MSSGQVTTDYTVQICTSAITCAVPVSSIDVYSFLSAPSVPVATTMVIRDLIQESNADITSHGILNQQYAAQVSCALSQLVDR